MTAAPVAVAVVSWNTRDLLDRCLSSLAPAATDGLAEIWVVDNGSTDGSAALVTERHPWAKLVEPGQNLGFGAAVNLVAACTRGEWIAASNADIEMTPEALERLLAAGAAHREAGALAPRLVLPDGSTQHSVYAFPSLSLALVSAFRLARLAPGLARRYALLGHGPDRSEKVDWAVAAFLLIRRSAFEAVGGFDERQWLFAEDLDLGWRLARSGWTSRYEPGAVVHHHESAATNDAFGADRTLRAMSATYLWMARRRGVLLTWVVAGIAFAASAAEYLLATGARRERARFWMRVHRNGLRGRPG